MRKITQEEIEYMDSGKFHDIWQQLQYSDQKSDFAQAYHINLQTMTSDEALINAYQSTH